MNTNRAGMDISTLAKVSPKAKLGARVSIGDFTIVHDNVVLGDDVVVENHCVIGSPTFPADGKNESELIGSADRALYKMKQSKLLTLVG